MKIDDVTIPESFFKFYDTGHNELNKFFGNLTDPEGTMLAGMKIPSCIMLAAARGTGKTRLSLALMSDLVKIHGEGTAVYFHNEMTQEAMAYVGSTMGASGVMLSDGKSMEKIEMTLLNNVVESARNPDVPKFQFVIIDSYDGMEWPVGLSKKEKSKVFPELAHRYEMCIILLCQKNVDGKAKGGTEIQHEVDTIFELINADPALYGSDKVKILSCMEKNRWAEQNFSVAYEYKKGRPDFTNAIPIIEIGNGEKVNKATLKKEILLRELKTTIRKSRYMGCVLTKDLTSLVEFHPELGDVAKLKRYLQCFVDNNEMTKSGRGDNIMYRIKS